MAWRMPISHGSTSSSTAAPLIRSTGFENTASSAATMMSHMQASMRPPGDALALNRSDGRLAEVVDPAALLDVHRLFMVELAFRRGSQLPEST